RSRRSPSCSWTPPGWRRSPTTSGQGSKRTRRASTARAAAVLAVVLALVLAGCGNPPQVVDISPSRGAADVHSGDPVRVRFDRPMDRASVASRFHLAPSAPFAIRQDPLDPRRVVLAPGSLLEPETDYSVTVTRDARDVDGNLLSAGSVVSFTTGAFRPLRHWIGFVAESAAGGPGA